MIWTGKIYSMQKWVLLLWGLIVIFGCDDKDQRTPGTDQGQEIVDHSIDWLGGNILDRAEISFDFRDQSLTYFNDHGSFRYTRVFPDTAGNTITDTLTNQDFIRYRNNQKLNLTEAQKTSLKAGVNSIIYFAFLPYKLNDPGVRKEYIGQVTIDERMYEKVKVSFPENEGTDAHNDLYYYYFDADDYSLDYLAYDFEENGGGIRFRSAYNVRKIDGLVIQDYINYMADPDSVNFAQIETYYNNEQLQELSRIELKNIEVNPITY